MMVHAGLAPKWPTQLAEKHAAEFEVQVHAAGYRKLFRNMYGDKPSWAPNLSGYDRSRAIINVLTRMRYCTPRVVSLVRSAGPGRARPEGRLRPLVRAGPDHHPGRARHRHRCGVGREVDRASARYRRAARGAGAGP
ncbi:hypothetical protein G6F63_014076 [Rhizopus arrhizus]|nr:hypothetical protein G6F63_014076 [Rhizopus arrhizus]